MSGMMASRSGRGLARPPDISTDSVRLTETASAIPKGYPRGSNVKDRKIVLAGPFCSAYMRGPNTDRPASEPHRHLLVSSPF